MRTVTPSSNSSHFSRELQTTDPRMCELVHTAYENDAHKVAELVIDLIGEPPC
jgi:hypothetical protein